MDNIVVDSLRDLNISIKKQLFIIGKKNGVINPPSPLQARIFMYIYEHKEENITPAFLARELNVSKVAVGEALNKMQKNGNIKISEAEFDGRKKILSYTDEGLLKMEKMRVSIKNLDSKIVRDISDEDLNVFINVINKMRSNLEEDNDV